MQEPSILVSSSFNCCVVTGVVQSGNLRNLEAGNGTVKFGRGSMIGRWLESQGPQMITKPILTVMLAQPSSICSSAHHRIT